MHINGFRREVAGKACQAGGPPFGNAAIGMPQAENRGRHTAGHVKRFGQRDAGQRDHVRHRLIHAEMRAGKRALRRLQAVAG